MSDDAEEHSIRLRQNRVSQIFMIGVLILLTIFIATVIGIVLEDQQVKSKRNIHRADVHTIFDGEHNLHKMATINEATSSATGQFCLIAASFEGSTTTTTSIKFYWQIDESNYVLSSLPMEKIRVKINEKIVTPTITFKLGDISGRRNTLDKEIDIQQIINESVYYATITLKEEDWPLQIKPPLNQ